MEKRKIRNFIISSAVVWGAVLIYVAYILKGTEFKNEIIGVIAGLVFPAPYTGEYFGLYPAIHFGAK